MVSEYLGNSIVNVVGLLLTEIFASWLSRISLQFANPRPVPPFLVVNNGRNILSKLSSGIPWY